MAYATTVDDASNSNIACWLSDRASSDPSLPAIKQGEHVLTYAALDGAAARCATLLADRGVTAGDRVALIMPNVAYFPIAYYAILRLGAVVVPMNPLLKAGEVSYAWNDAGVKVAVVFAMFAEEAAKAAEVTGTDVLVVTPGEFEQTLAGAEPHEGGPVVRTGDDTAVILYTSGTTGSPKGAELTHDNLGSNVRTDLATLMPIGPGDVVFGGLPLFHSFGQTCGAERGDRGRCLPDPAAEVRRRGGAADRGRGPGDRRSWVSRPCTWRCSRVPDPGRFDTSRLKLAASGGASLPVEVLYEVQRRFGFQLLEGYGLSETSPIASFNHPDRPVKPGSVGIPIRRRRVPALGTRRHRGGRRRGGRDRHPRRERDEGLLEQARGHRRGDAGGLVPQRGSGHPRRRRLLLHRRPEEGHDHPQRDERVPARGRGGPLHPPGGGRGGGVRGAGCVAR